MLRGRVRSKDFEEIVKRHGKSRAMERELLEQYGQIVTLVKCFAWLQRCDECIEWLEELCHAKRPRLAVGHKQSAVARIARLAKVQSRN